MKLTSKQQEELIVWEYFIPQTVKWLPKTDKDIEMFFEWSEQGKHKAKGVLVDNSYFNALREGKRWAGIHWGMYEDGVVSGDFPYIVLLSGKDRLPRPVVNQMKREMFKGKDADVIEECYQMIQC
jgi:hypothetical protein